MLVCKLGLKEIVDSCVDEAGLHRITVYFRIIEKDIILAYFDVVAIAVVC